MKFSIRLDDACPEMNVCNWLLFEEYFRQEGLMPIIGVIPDNKDISIQFGQYAKFWDRVQIWQGLGWQMALHGLNHVYHEIDRNDSLIPINNKSEFVGLPVDEQIGKIGRGLEIFHEKGIETSMFMAPSHSLDFNTLEALRYFPTIETMCDGLSFRSYKRYGFKWISQQLWRPRSLPFGEWSVCIHPNEMSLDEVKKIINLLDKYGREIASNRKTDTIPDYGAADALFEFFYLNALGIKFKL